MSMKKQKKPGKIFTVDADADTGENRSVQRRNWPVNGKTDTGCACEKPCRRHVRKAQVSASAEVSDGKLRETQTANYFSDIYPIDCAVLSANA